MAWWSVFRAGYVGPVPPRDASGTAKRLKDNEPQRGIQEWQRKAWDFYETLGEIHYAGSFYARMLSGVRLMIEQFGPPPPDVDSVAEPVDEWQECANEELNMLLTRLSNARGGLESLQGDYGRLRFVQGEAQLTRTLVPPEEMPGEISVDSEGNQYVECWEMLSAEELTFDHLERLYTRRSGTGTSTDAKIPETDPDDPLLGSMMAWRFYHRDARFSGMADCSMRAVLSDCEELALLKQAIRNTGRNRGAGNGVLIFPSSMTGSLVPMPDGSKVPENAQKIYDSLTAPIKNEKAASAVAPVILFAPPGTTANDIFHVDLRGAALYREVGLRDECIRRIAIGLDMPPEELSGMATANHWTAWQIDDARWSRHGEPVCREFCGQLTAALLAPLCTDLGLDPSLYRFWYDATEVVQDPDRARAAQEAHANLTISDAAYREAAGWDESDAPEPDEWEKRAELSPHRSGTRGDQREPDNQQASAERVIGMAEACVLRCRELAGSKLRTKMQANGAPANLRARIVGSRNADVALRLGEDVRGSCDPDVLVAGAGQVFLSGLIGYGMDPSLAERVVRCTEEHAARTLFDEHPGPLPDEVLALCALLSQRR